MSRVLESVDKNLKFKGVNAVKDRMIEGPDELEMAA